MRKSLWICLCVNTIVAIALSVYLFVLPVVLVVRDLGDPRWHTPQPKCQVLVWGILVVCTPILWRFLSPVIGLITLLAALTFPMQRRRPPGMSAPDARR